jgi:hypothetical protein
VTFTTSDGRKFSVVKTVILRRRLRDRRMVWVRPCGDQSTQPLQLVVALAGKDIWLELGDGFEDTTFRSFQVDSGPITGTWSLC